MWRDRGANKSMIVQNATGLNHMLRHGPALAGRTEFGYDGGNSGGKSPSKKWNLAEKELIRKKLKVSTFIILIFLEKQLIS